MEKISPKQLRSIIRKALAVILAGAFLFTGVFGWAKEDKLFSTLALPTRMTQDEFRDEYLARYILLAHTAVNTFIGNYIRANIKNNDIRTL